eukprot:m.54312 g.54312  ORF g.54312 m.54312 type:complete len:61 (+) comp21888_c0_seq1:1136-1318(+)
MCIPQQYTLHNSISYTTMYITTTHVDDNMHIHNNIVEICISQQDNTTFLRDGSVFGAQKL